MVRLVRTLTGSTANQFIGIIYGQMDSYSLMVDHLRHRFDPPATEEATKDFSSEPPDVFAECLGAASEFVMDRFRKGHLDTELNRYYFNSL